jgi:Na+/H+-translocating membrane pyrophosphatase
LGDEVEGGDTSAAVLKRMKFIGLKITEGANSFLGQEYLYLGIFAAIFSILLGLTVDW